jgi:hypothetical protein
LVGFGQVLPILIHQMIPSASYILNPWVVGYILNLMDQFESFTNILLTSGYYPIKPKQVHPSFKKHLDIK